MRSNPSQSWMQSVMQREGPLPLNDIGQSAFESDFNNYTQSAQWRFHVVVVDDWRCIPIDPCLLVSLFGIYRRVYRVLTPTRRHLHRNSSHSPHGKISRNRHVLSLACNYCHGEWVGGLLILAETCRGICAKPVRRNNLGSGVGG